MNLQNGKYYTTANGLAVKAQVEADGDMHCYDVKGNEVHSMAADGHVEGWSPVGAAIFIEARKVAKAKLPTRVEKSASKETKKK